MFYHTRAHPTRAVIVFREIFVMNNLLTCKSSYYIIPAGKHSTCISLTATSKIQICLFYTKWICLIILTTLYFTEICVFNFKKLHLRSDLLNVTRVEYWTFNYNFQGLETLNLWMSVELIVPQVIRFKVSFWSITKLLVSENNSRISTRGCKWLHVNLFILCSIVLLIR